MPKNLNNSFKENINKSLVSVLFFCYIIIFIWIVFLKCNRQSAMNILANKYLLYNLKERWLFQFSFNTFTDEYAIIQLVLNIPLFIPLPLFLPFVFKKQNIIRDLFVVLLVTILVEIIQLFTSLGGFDYKDIIFNFIGGLIGCVIFKLLARYLKDKTINYMLLVLSVILVPFSMFCLINTIVHYDFYIPFFNGDNFRYLYDR